MAKHWWKILGVAFILYSIVFGLLRDLPNLPNLRETIRNLFYHVPMWFAMILLLFISLIYSIKYLRSQKELHDQIAIQSINTGIIFGLIGFATGCVWGNFAWGSIGAFLVKEPKSLASAIAILIYLAYVVLRGSIEDDQKKARVSAVFNIFAFVLFITFIIVIPRLTASLHPGADGNPAFSYYDADESMRWIFYPAVIGWMLIGVWIVNMRVRLKKLEWKTSEV